MKTVPLTRGHVAMVDDEDYDRVMKYRWFANVKERNVYALRSTQKADGGFTTEPMHRLIMGCPEDMQVDHINHNGLDNRRCNLRLVNRSGNAQNSRAHLDKPGPRPSRFKGVVWHQRDSRWLAQIKANGKRHHLGSFITEEEAARAYNFAAREMHGEHAFLNDLPETACAPTLGF